MFDTDRVQTSSGPSAWRLPGSASFRRLWWVVCICFLGGGLGGLVVSFLQTPQYVSSSTLYITTSGSGDSTQSVYQGSLASEQRATSYVGLATSDAVLRKAVRGVAGGVSVDAAREALTAEVVPDTVLLTVTAKTDSPEESAALVNAVTASMTEYIRTLEVPSGGGAPLAKLTVVSPGTVDRNPVEPRTARNVALGLAVGLFFGLALNVFAGRVDQKIRSDQDLRELVDGPVLANIPAERSVSDSSPVDFSLGASRSAESYRVLRTNIGFVSIGGKSQSFLVTSSNAGEGKSTTVVNLAAALAEDGKSVVVVDADLRRPMLSTLFGLAGLVGLTDYLRGRGDIGALVQRTEISGLHVLGSGELPPNPAELLGGPGLRRLIDELCNQFDYVIVDSSPVLPVTDAAVASHGVDGVLFVVKCGHTSRRDVVESLNLLEIAEVTPAGFIINAVPELGGSGAGYYRPYTSLRAGV